MSTSEHQTQAESWPRKLNKALIAIGVIAFGLIVTDRLLEAFRADDLPAEDTALAVPAMPAPVAVTETVIEPTSDTVVDVATQLELPEPEVVQDERKTLLELESMFGSKVVFVSASEPAYLVTADERRFNVGSVLDNDTILAGITAQQIFFDQSGDTIVIPLPEPTVQ